LNPSDFKRLVAAGLTTDQIAIVMEMMERDAKLVAEADEARKAKGRERVAKWRFEHRSNVTVTQPNVTVRLARVEDKSLTTEIEPQEEKKVSKRGTRLPENFNGDFKFAEASGLSHSQAQTELAKFRDYWMAKAGAAGVKLDWNATWRNWVRTAAERLPRAGPTKDLSAAEIFGQMAKISRARDESDNANHGTAGDNLFILPSTERR